MSREQAQTIEEISRELRAAVIRGDHQEAAYLEAEMNLLIKHWS